MKPIFGLSVAMASRRGHGGILRRRSRTIDKNQCGRAALPCGGSGASTARIAIARTPRQAAAVTARTSGPTPSPRGLDRSAIRTSRGKRRSHGGADSTVCSAKTANSSTGLLTEPFDVWRAVLANPSAMCLRNQTMGTLLSSRVSDSCPGCASAVRVAACSTASTRDRSEWPRMVTNPPKKTTTFRAIPGSRSRVDDDRADPSP
jgi:hypothetical protein